MLLVLLRPARAQKGCRQGHCMSIATPSNSNFYLCTITATSLSNHNFLRILKYWASAQKEYLLCLPPAVREQSTTEAALSGSCKTR